MRARIIAARLAMPCQAHQPNGQWGLSIPARTHEGRGRGTCAVPVVGDVARTLPRVDLRCRARASRERRVQFAQVQVFYLYGEYL